MGYAEAIEQQARRLRWWQTEHGHYAAEYYFRNFRDMGEMIGSADDVIAAQIRELSHAEPFYVGAAICDWLIAAVETLPDSALQAADAPVPRGWVWFERPLPLPPYDTGEASPLRALSFMPVYLRPGIRWGGQREEHDSIANGMAQTFYAELSDGALWPSSVGSWPYGDKWTLPRDKQRRDSAVVGRMNAYMYCLFTFLRQSLLVAARTPVTDRATRRRLARQDIHDPVVKVVQLRRRDYQQHDESSDRAVEYSCQWVVRGHWHQYHTREGVQPRWVAPYLKGDPAKPLKAPTITAYEVVR